MLFKAYPNTLENLLSEREIFRIFKANGYVVEKQEICEESQVLCMTLYGEEASEIHKIYKGEVDGGKHRHCCLLTDLKDGRLHAYNIKRNGSGMMQTINTAKIGYPHHLSIEQQAEVTRSIIYAFYLKDDGVTEWDME